MDDSEHDVIEYDEEQGSDAPWWSGLLSIEVSAITGYTLAVVGLIGGGFIAFPAAQAVVGFGYEPEDMPSHMIVAATIVLLVLLWAFWLARHALLDAAAIDDAEDAPEWCRHLGGSAALVSAVGATLSAMTIIGGLLQRSPA
jgi:hypothetical protein